MGIGTPDPPAPDRRGGARKSSANRADRGNGRAGAVPASRSARPDDPRGIIAVRGVYECAMRTVARCRANLHTPTRRTSRARSRLNRSRRAGGLVRVASGSRESATRRGQDRTEALTLSRASLDWTQRRRPPPSCFCPAFGVGGAARNALSVRRGQRLVRYHSHHRRMCACSKQDRNEPPVGPAGRSLVLTLEVGELVTW
jgi:hypothetical protein